jgi:antitoxin component of MazEF toxin-antitoxin module
MKTHELRVTAIGNSRGVRIPAETLKRFQIGESVIMEERPEGILLRPRRAYPRKLSWGETAVEMEAAHEDWSAWSAVDHDGLADCPWAAEARPAYGSRKRGKKAR